MAQRKTVTLFVYLPQSHTVILSRRGKLEHHAGVLQATAHGQVEAGEVPQLALKREFKEEVKGNFDELVQIQEFGSNTVGATTPELTYYFGAVLADDMANTLQPTQEVSEMVRVGEADLKSIVKYSTVRGKDDYDVAANKVMFDDELETLKKVFAAYKEMK